ncbi:nuclear factor interleukin-3-regulated protein [Apis mellifera caucasica]|uniref:Nuclear factor interleukin-3-regulated protein n=1 Tax=Apis mellifera TaxID=7460 RepID=A0A7M7MVA3_APIME|nr:nuclear factor interleukin-3-regulated protein [Apis mellifera]KAG6795279.1 nuclear factor interleukin-3-regulated protein [Apis mellifera caucasica]KAG9428701.1 nuclear factor interleukin-3-regulated protein [Apis mellifera carnica]|eukprot:XP_026301354.1 nuclear factor interleukin-3-regulated protein [Apis mellifera]
MEFETISFKGMSSHAHARTICSGSAVTSAVSALHFLKSYSLFTPTSDLCRYEPYNSKDYNFGNIDILETHQTNTPDITIGRTSSPLTPSSLSTFSLPGSLLQPPFLSTIPPLMQSINMPPTFSNNNTSNMVSRHFLSANSITNIHKRPRSEKKPIPDDQKDEKYYERRKRNNQAAKKSRDARKIREDNIALRATILEHENAILRAQVITLREEAQCLRHMLIKQQTSPLQSINRSISSITPVTLSPSHSTATLDCQI